MRHTKLSARQIVEESMKIAGKTCIYTNDSVTYEELARRLREHHGLDETKVSVANKLSRGTFSASFFFAAMKAIGRENVNLEEV